MSKFDVVKVRSIFYDKRKWRGYKTESRVSGMNRLFGKDCYLYMIIKNVLVYKENKKFEEDTIYIKDGLFVSKNKID